MAPKPNRDNVRTRLAFTLIASLWLPSAVGAQGLAVIDSLLSADTTITAIPAGSIPGEALEASANMRAIRERADLGSLVKETRREWAAQSVSWSDLKREAEESLRAGADRIWLIEIERSWSNIQSDMNARLQGLASQASGLDDDLSTLSHMQRRWELTADLARRTSLPSSIQAQIDSVLHQIEELRPFVWQQLNEALDLEAELAQKSQEADRMLRRIRDLTVQEWSSYVRQDQRSVLEMLLEGEDQSAPSGTTRSYTMMRIRSAIRFLSEHVSNIWLHLAFLILLIWLSRTLNRRITDWIGSEAEQPVETVVFRRPYSSALLIALVTTEFIYPGAPVTLVSIAVLLSIAPTYRLLAARLPAVLIPPLRVFVGFLLVEVAVDVLVTHSWALWRILTFVLAVIAAVGLGWFVGRAPAADRLRTTATGRRVLMGLRVSILLFSFAAASSLAGYGALSGHLTGAIVYSLYFLMLVYIGALVMKAILFALLKSPFAARSRVITGNFDRISKRLNQVVNVLAVLEAIHAVLEQFGVDIIVLEWLSDALTAEISIGEVGFAVGDILLFLLTFWVAILVARFIRFLLEEEILSRVRMGRGRPQAISGTIYYILVVCGLVFALSVVGMPMDRLTVLAGAFGIGIGFGLQDVVNNFVSGLILLYESPIQVGDTIEFGTRMGVVQHIGIRSSVVRTFEGAEVSVPNSHLVSNDVTNWTMSDTRRRITVLFGVAYGTDVARIPDLVLPLAKEHAEIERDPEPVLLFAEMGESSLNFELRCWTSSSDWLVIKSYLTSAIYDRLGEAGIEIPFPQRDLHLKSVGPGMLEGRATVDHDAAAESTGIDSS